MPTTTQTESRMKNNLAHLKHHVKYPADQKTVLAACNNMSDVGESDRAWFNSSLPAGNYKGPTDVLNALLNKV